ncbi:MAG: hypothetical protein Q7U23_13425 [Methylococcales bacterium]|nr:hypothetical protein [Methylococcales bacterium]
MPNYEINYHPFTAKILEILEKHFAEYAVDVFEASPLLGYLNIKTKSANSGSKARGAFANHYALYVLIEDYIAKGFFNDNAGYEYSQYEGARFNDLFRRQRELPFGAKLQNHALNARLNDEFKKFYSTLGKQPIIRDIEKQRYWIQDDLLQVQIRQKNGIDCIYNIAHAIIEIIDAYVASKKAAFEEFIDTCQQIAKLSENNPEKAIDFVIQQLKPTVDARIFEIVSYAVLKAKYGQQTIWLGDEKETVAEEALILYKTGRTNANDGGIDFVMKPLGLFFQVTETVDVGKYFLDIDKVQRFPITFVVKSDETIEQIRATIRNQALTKYKIEAVVESYMAAVEEIINTQSLIDAFTELLESAKLQEVMNEIITQSKVEFNHSNDEL